MSSTLSLSLSLPRCRQQDQFGPDFVPVRTNITLDPESLTGSVQFSAKAEGLYEQPEETFTVIIVSVSGAGIDSETQEVNVTILDTDSTFL